MSRREIRTFPDPVLLRPAEDVDTVNGDIRRLIEDMMETMYDARGVGLAAPQVGVSLRVIVVDVSRQERPPEAIALVNPVILSAEGEEQLEEGCLSIPDFSVKIARSTRVTVEGLDQEGRRSVFEAEGILARALQHEIDHIQGILIVDRLRGLKKEMARKKLRKKFQPAASY